MWRAENQLTQINAIYRAIKDSFESRLSKAFSNCELNLKGQDYVRFGKMMQFNFNKLRAEKIDINYGFGFVQERYFAFRDSAIRHKRCRAIDKMDKKVQYMLKLTKNANMSIISSFSDLRMDKAALSLIGEPDEKKDSEFKMLSSTNTNQPIGINMDATINEFLLFHGGSNADIATKIFSEGFDQRFSRDGMFGSGLYFADTPAKSDQYCYPDKHGTLYIIIGRVCLGGCPAVIDMKDFFNVDFQAAIFEANTTQHNSVLLTQTGISSVIVKKGTSIVPGLKYNEYIIYDHSAAVPVAKVEYKRVLDTAPSPPTLSTSKPPEDSCAIL